MTLGSEKHTILDKTLNTLWTTLASGKSRYRRVRPCVLNVEVNADDGANGASLDIDGNELNLESKDILWMFTAHTCSCCGVRERELLCTYGDSESALTDFYGTYPMLKAVESGQDVRGTGRVELMFKDGETLSVGLECTTEDGRSQFKATASCLAKLGHLEVYKSVDCKTRRRRPLASPSSALADVKLDSVASQEADRHMQELLETTAIESVAQAQSLERKRKKRKANLKRHAIAEEVGSTQKPFGGAHDSLAEDPSLDTPILEPSIDSTNLVWIGSASPSSAVSTHKLLAEEIDEGANSSCPIPPGQVSEEVDVAESIQGSVSVAEVLPIAGQSQNELGPSVEVEISTSTASDIEAQDRRPLVRIARPAAVPACESHNAPEPRAIREIDINARRVPTVFGDSKSPVEIVPSQQDEKVTADKPAHTESLYCAARPQHSHMTRAGMSDSSFGSDISAAVADYLDGSWSTENVDDSEESCGCEYGLTLCRDAGEYKVDEFTSPVIPMIIVPMKPRARILFASSNEPAKIEVRSMLGGSRTSREMLLYGACHDVPNILGHSSGGRAKAWSVDSDGESDNSTICCDAQCCSTQHESL